MSGRARVTGAALTLALLAASCASLPAPALRFSVPAGRALNEFYRQGPVAAHLVLTSGPKPRLLIAFPAGNSGVALWFDAPSDPLAWQPHTKLAATRRELGDRTRYGVSVELVASGGPVWISQAIVSNVRVLRDFEDTGQAPAAVLVAPQVSERSAVWERRRLDGAAGYFLSIEVLSGTLTGRGAGPIGILPGPHRRMRLRVTALTGDPPLTPLAEDQLLGSGAAPDERLRSILAFLSYEEKLLAGSWRFNTYFGRDTLMSLRLLAPVLQARPFEAGLSAVLERLSTTGEVAHEEEVGEYALLRRLRMSMPLSDAPLLDYKMIDDDFMLAPVAAHYLLDTPGGRAHAAAFLSRQTAGGASYGAALVRNFGLVIAATIPFAREPRWQQLIALKTGESAGNWRDSDDGLGGGRYPYDVNGVFAPAALEAIARLHASGLLSPYVDREREAQLSQAATLAHTWLREAPPLFDVAVASATARSLTQSYARQVGVDSTPAMTALATDAVHFRAVALDADGRPVPILNSDEGLALLFLDPAPADVQRIAETLLRPFPAGLLTDVGLLVANPAFAPRELQPAFDRARYHGTVIWSWQQAVLAAGIERQLRRENLPARARVVLEQGRTQLRTAMAATATARGSELWSWSQTAGRYRLEAFGQRPGDVTESNAAQLWSTVQLAQPLR